MQTEITVNDDKSIITVFLPITLKKHAGKKTIISPKGESVNQDRDAKQDLTLLKTLVKAHRYQRMVTNGTYRSINQMCESENISKGYISAVVRLVTLAPDIQEAILNSTYPTHLTRADFIKIFPVDWLEQRKHFGFIAK